MTPDGASRAGSAPGVGTAASAPEAGAGIEALRARIVEAIRTVYDPEIPVNIYELGLVYGVEVAPGGAARVTMTLTSPMCPVAGSLPIAVEDCVRAVPGVTAARVDLVWDPPWNPSMMSEAARLQLNLL